MKKILFLLSFIFVTALLSDSYAAVNDEVASAGFSFTMLYTWIADHWASLALIISEIAALLSGKWSGILKSVVNILGTVFTKKNG